MDMLREATIPKNIPFFSMYLSNPRLDNSLPTPVLNSANFGLDAKSIFLSWDSPTTQGDICIDSEGFDGVLDECLPWICPGSCSESRRKKIMCERIFTQETITKVLRPLPKLYPEDAEMQELKKNLEKYFGYLARCEGNFGI